MSYLFIRLFIFTIFIHNFILIQFLVFLIIINHPMKFSCFIYFFTCLFH